MISVQTRMQMGSICFILWHRRRMMRMMLFTDDHLRTLTPTYAHLRPPTTTYDHPRPPTTTCDHKRQSTTTYYHLARRLGGSGRCRVGSVDSVRSGRSTASGGGWWVVDDYLRPLTTTYDHCTGSSRGGPSTAIG